MFDIYDQDQLIESMRDREKEKYDSIIEFNKFENNLKGFFSKGINTYQIGKKQKLYFVSSNWIKNWKKKSNYQKVIENLDKDITYLKNKNILRKDEDEFIPSDFDTQSNENIFLSKIIYSVKDFNCLINYSIYLSIFQNPEFLNNIYFEKLKYIEGYFYEKMIVLLIEKQKRIKILFIGETENKTELIQINLDFLEKNDNQKKETSFFVKNFWK